MAKGRSPPPQRLVGVAFDRIGRRCDLLGKFGAGAADGDGQRAVCPGAEAIRRGCPDGRKIDLSVVEQTGMSPATRKSSEHCFFPLEFADERGFKDRWDEISCTTKGTFPRRKVVVADYTTNQIMV